MVEDILLRKGPKTLIELAEELHVPKEDLGTLFSDLSLNPKIFLQSNGKWDLKKGHKLSEFQQIIKEDEEETEETFEDEDDDSSEEDFEDENIY